MEQGVAIFAARDADQNAVAVLDEIPAFHRLADGAEEAALQSFAFGLHAASSSERI